MWLAPNRIIVVFFVIGESLVLVLDPFYSTGLFLGLVVLCTP